jgi:hypothetical protein
MSRFERRHAQTGETFVDQMIAVPNILITREAEEMIRDARFDAES